MTADRPDVLVVGAGSAGCVLAARLSENLHRTVALLEAGPLHVHDWPADLLEASLVPAGHAETWQHPCALTPARTGTLVRGRVVGGSGAVNGAYFVRATPADVDAWPGLTFDELLPSFVRSESDEDFDGPRHGSDGPLPVRRSPVLHPLSAQFVDACRAAGFADEPDKNAGAAAGVGPLPRNVHDRVRVNTALAYLLPALGRPNLQVRPGAEVARVLVVDGCARGVQLVGGELVHAEVVVLCAGAIGSAALLLRSGVGPAEDLRALGLEVHADLPVGRSFSDHPDVAVAHVHAEEWTSEAGTAPLEVTLNTPTVELRPYTAGFDRLVPGSGADPQPCVGVALVVPESRGTLRLRSTDPAVAPQIEHHYLASARDRELLADGVRLAHELLEQSPQTDVEDWVQRNLGTSQHLVGTCALGTVVDEGFAVQGVVGLRVVDAAALPVVPSRGPHATVVALAEHAAARWSA